MATGRHVSGVMPATAARTSVRAADWQSAVRSAVQLLVDLDVVEPGYREAAVEVVERSGPYIVLAPGVALAHARPEDGAKALGLSVVVLDRPVAFGHPTNDPVDVVFAFGSPDRDQHVGLLGSLARHLRDGLVERLRNAAGDEDVRRSLDEVMKDVQGPRTAN